MTRLALALALTAALPAGALAQGRWLDRGGWLTAVRDQDGGLVVTDARGHAFHAGLGTDRVVLTLRASVDLAQLDVAVDEVLSARAQIFAVRSTRGEDPFALAERLAPLVARGALASAVPDLALAHHRSSITVPPNDPRYGGQWFFQTIHIEDAWRHQDGDPSVTIAVVDDGCDLTHPDLVPHLLQGYDALDDDMDPSYLPGTAGNNHGTSCAGLVAAATDNGLDVAGTCPECALRCIRLLGADGTLIPISTDVRAFDFAMMQADVAVVSNSWGFAAGDPAPGPLVDIITGIQRDGRGGLGAVVVFAAGNDASTIGPAEVQAIAGVVTVGAINTFDEAASFSNMGDCLSLVAPTGTLTTDIVGAEGADPGETTSSFGGTSSACPIVAGVVGLMVSQRPDMNAADLRAALIATVRPAPFAVPDAMGHDALYGYGIVDPGAALNEIDPTAMLDAGTPDSGASDGGVPDAGAAPSPAPSGCNCRVGAGDSGSGAGLAAVALALLVLVRRRRSRAVLALVLAAGCTTPSTIDVRVAEDALRPATLDESLVSPGGSFRIHFTRTGGDAVNPDDRDSTGIPDYVEYVADQYDMVLARYSAMGFRVPRSDVDVASGNGGDGLFDVYLVDFTASGGGSDGAFVREDCVTGSGCAGYMLQENDFVGFAYPSVHYGARLLASHEFFHAIQAAYDDQLGVQGGTLSESGAVWASERFDASQTDMEEFATAFLMRPDRQLGVDPVGPVQPYTYGAAIVWEYYTTDVADDALMVAFWDQLDMADATTSNWLDVLDAVLVRDHSTSFATTYVDFAEWLMFTGSRSDPAHGPARGSQFAEVATSAIDLPYHTLSTRIFPASTHYFSIPFPPPVSVRLTGAAADRIDVIAVSFEGVGSPGTELEFAL